MTHPFPLIDSYDLIVVGGTVAGVAAAVSARQADASVLLVSASPYVGEDLCRALRFARSGQPCAPEPPDFTGMFPDNSLTTNPLRVKRVLSEAIQDAGVEFLLETFAVDALFDAGGEFSGLLLANRAGAQVVLCQTLIDATPRAWTARRAGACATAWQRQTTCRRIVIGGAEESTDERSTRVRVQILRDYAVEPDADSVDAYEYTLDLDIPSGDFRDLAAAEQRARDLTYRPGQLRSAQSLEFTPADRIICQFNAEDWHGFDAFDPAHFHAKDNTSIWILGPCAGLPAEAVEAARDPARAQALGRRIGLAAAASTHREAPPSPPYSSPPGGEPVSEQETLKVPHSGLRPSTAARQLVPCHVDIPRWGDYDVVVVGGGTAGAAAAIGAGRAGRRVLLLEYQEGLGGVGTVGLIGKPYHGRPVGFAKDVPFPHEEGTVDDKMEWLRVKARECGVEIWLGALGWGAITENDRVRGVAVATEQGAGVVTAEVVIDATGSADIAIAAGADYMYGDDDGRDIALQGCGLPVRPLYGGMNTDFLLVDETDMLDVRRALVGPLQTMDENAYDEGTLIQTRERRRIVGDHVLCYLDQVAGRTYPDTIVYSASDYDTHGYPSDPYFALFPHDAESLKANHPAPGASSYTPYRCLLPRGLEGILVVGLGISMRRDASAFVRMQRDVLNQGYAAGTAAAMASQAACPLRDIDVRALQTHLVETGALPPDALKHRDSFPWSTSALRNAVGKLASVDDLGRPAVCTALAAVMAHAEQCRDMLMDAWQEASGPQRLIYAKILGVLGESAVVPNLIDALQKAGPWAPRILQGRMAEYAHLPTPQDGLILALGHTRDRRALPVLLDRLRMLDANVTLSHHRSVTGALEMSGAQEAAEPLAELLEKPGMQGHAMTRIEPLYDQPPERRRRIGPLREIVIARALYRCGDWDRLGERILSTYVNDIRGLFARHATAVLRTA